MRLRLVIVNRAGGKVFFVMHLNDNRMGHCVLSESEWQKWIDALHTNPKLKLGITSAEQQKDAAQ